MKKRLIILISILIFINSVVFVNALDALVVWDDRPNTIGQYRTWNGTDWSNENDTIDQTGIIYYPFLIEMAASPLNDEAIFATIDDYGDFNVQNVPNVHFQVYNGSEWGNNFTTNFSSLAAHPGGHGETFRSLDVQYYNNSNAMVVWWDYENAITVDTSIAAYAIWDGNNWKEMNNTPDWTGPDNPRQQELDCYVPNEECVLVQTLFDSNNVSAGIWNGTDWDERYNTSILDAANLSFYTSKGIDVEYDHNGNAMVVVASYIDNNPPDTDAVYYRIWNSTSKTWGNLTSAIGNLDRPTFIELAVHPTENEMALIVVDTDNIARVAVWNGTEWGNNQIVNTLTPYNYFTIDIAYDKDGNAMAVFSNYSGTINNIAYIIWNGTEWGNRGKAIDMSVGANWHTNIRLVSDPSSNEMILTDVTGADHAIHIQVWNGTEWGNNLELDPFGHWWTRSSDVVYADFGLGTPTLELGDSSLLSINGSDQCCGVDINFTANYSDTQGFLISGANCNITFDNNGTFFDMGEGNLYYFEIAFACDETPQNQAWPHIFNVTCDHTSYLLNESNSTFTIYQGDMDPWLCGGGTQYEPEIPEFNIIGILLILIIATVGYIVVSKRK